MHRVVVVDQEEAASAIAHGLDSALQKNLRVLWLLSGGSNIQVALNVLRQLRHATRDNLTISMIDERFVPLESGHSNWHALLEGGMNGQQATLEPPIINWTLSLDDAAHDWAVRLGERTGHSDLIIGLFGVGTDGHTAGILPHTAGVHEHDKLVLGYKGADFERLTATPAFFKRLDLAIGVVMGEAKKQVLERMPTDISADDQPAQLLNSIPELIMYTDQNVEWS